MPSKGFGAGVLVLLFCLLAVPVASAQEFQVEGTVVAADDGSPLPGVNVVETGTQNGTTTNAEGAFSLEVNSPQASLTFSYVGFATQTVEIDGRSELTVELETRAEELEGVVVTALGIERQQQSLGYATSEVEAEDLVDVTESNPANLLQGNVPGLVISPNASGPNASTSINIRGASSIGGDNDPLFIVDGIPIDNTVFGSVGQFGGRDGGSALSIVSPGNIASISVLKGAGAAALYGTRARDGVILIETKSGRGVSPEGYSVQYSSTVTARNILGGFTDYQSQYGQGTRGLAPTTQSEARDAGLSSWGARLDAVDETVQFDGETRPYEKVVDREGFYRTGLSQKHSLALNGGYENASFRFSASHLNDASVVPNSGYEQTNVTLRGQSTFGNLTADASFTYQNELYDNRIFLNDAPRNPNYIPSFMPANIPLSALEPGYTGEGEGVEKQFSSDVFLTNPYWAVERMDADDDRDRMLGNVRLDYQISDWLSVQGQTGLDWYSLDRTTVDAYGTAFEPEGSLDESETRVWESNTQLMASATPSLTDELSLRLDLGGNLRHRQSEGLTVLGSNFSIPYFRDLSNMSNQTTDYSFSEQQVRSFFGSAAFTYSDYLYLTLTGRSDWSSTLPEENLPFFYPSVSGSFVFSEALEMPDWLSYGKLRASWAEIGGDTDPYQLLLTYSLLSAQHQDQTMGTIEQTTVPNLDLKPTTTREVEMGFETQFFDDRFGIDFTWYRRSTIDQILSATVSGASGFRNRTINSGEVQNSGVEMLLMAFPVTTEDWNWETRINFGANRNEVKSLAEGLDIRVDQANRMGTANIAQIVGEPVNVLYGTPYVRDDQGRIVHDENGFPLEGESEVLGNGAPDWSLGFSNTVAYKNVSLNFLIDAKWGGQILSGTNANAYGLGLHKNTLEGRAACDEQIGEDGYPQDGCFVGDGVIGSVNDDGEVEVDRENDVEVLPSAYYSSVAGIAEEFIYDANLVQLRQVRISYELPGRLVERTPLNSVQLSLVGRNLFYLYDAVPNVNPESSYNNQGAPGFERAGIPQTRNIGFTLNVQL